MIQSTEYELKINHCNNELVIADSSIKVHNRALI